ncbi:MAG: hypothetical protein HYY06_21295 [Deltaproteobacteria bacterium]|nr:hypothetical protein [Deltaproteobacteria bacterium]
MLKMFVEVLHMKLGRAAPAVLAVLGLAVADRSSAQTEPGPVHPVIEAYHLTLALLLPEEAMARLELVDTGGTAAAPLSAVAYRVADAAVRRFAPLALEAAGRNADALQLRRLAVLSDFQSADRAEQLLKRLTDSRPTEGRSPLPSAVLESLLSARMAARQAMHADRPATPDRILSGTERAAPMLANDPATDPDGSEPGASDPYSTPEQAYSVTTAAEASAMAAREVITAAGAAHDALRAGANPIAVIDASIQSLNEMVTIARRYAPPTPSRRPVPSVPAPPSRSPSMQPEPSPIPSPEPRPALPPAQTQPPPIVPNSPYEPTPARPTES